MKNNHATYNFHYILSKSLIHYTISDNTYFVKFSFSISYTVAYSKK